MRTTLKHTLAACIALGALMLTGTACTQDDPLGGNNPAGTQLLQLGKVTIAGAETATRSADAATRADIAPDATTGFTGIRKHAFVKDDELVLTLTPPATGGSGTPVKVTATLSADGTTWTLPKTYFTAGTTIDARYTPATGKQPGGIRYSDDLVAINQDMKTDGTPLALTLTHANAMVEVTPPASLTGYENLTVTATPPAPAGGGAANTELLATNEEGTSTDLRHRTIAKAGSTLHSISLTVNTVVYTAPIDPPVQVAANKRYPITLKMSAEEGLTAIVAEGTDWGVGGDVNGYPTGLTRYISTAQDLQQLAADVNGGTLNDANVTVLQTADIDMTGIRNWKQIGIDKDYPFSGSYNGNGYSIKNLKIDGSSMLGTTHHIGLFGYIVGAKITGIHLRDCAVSFSGGGSVYAGALVGRAEDGCIVTLCSATGSVSVTGVQYAYAGGLVGYAVDLSSALNHFTRCTTDVAVTTSASADGYTCGFTGYTLNGHYAGCIASGKVTVNGKGVSSGFSHANSNTYKYHAIGCITNSEIEGGTGQTAFGLINTLRSCLATGTYTNLYIEASVKSSNAYLNAMGGTAANATNETAYGILVPSNSYMSNQTLMKTLHYSKAKGYTTTVVDIHHWHASGIWKNNGAKRPTIDMSYEGNPMSIIGGNKVYRVKDYYVTAPAAETDTYLWNGNTGSTTMSSDPCKTYGNWLMPTMEDFEAMAGWTGTSNAWNNAVSATTMIDDYMNFRMAFPIGYSFWSSTPNTNIGEAAKAWCFRTAVNGTSGSYETELKTTSYRIRCVQKQAFPTP